MGPHEAVRVGAAELEAAHFPQTPGPVSRRLCRSFRVLPKRASLDPGDKLLDVKVTPAYAGRPGVLPGRACGAKRLPPTLSLVSRHIHLSREHSLRASWC